jgi:acyl dehydratase
MLTGGKTGAPAQLAAVARLVLSRLRLPGRSDADHALHRASVSSDGLVATEAAIRKYLWATAGENPGSAARGGLVPPTLITAWETALLLDLLRVSGAPFPRRGIVHAFSEHFHLRSLRAGEGARVRLEVRAVDRSRRGGRLLVGCRVLNAAGNLIAEGELLYLLPGLDLGVLGAIPVPDLPDPMDGREWRELERWHLRPRHARRYARVAGDYNPIHLSALTARLFGFRRPILHGACIEAMVAHGLTGNVFGGDPSALRRLAIRFAAPLPLPAEATLEILEDDGGGSGAFRVTAPKLDSLLVSHGRWVGAAGSAIPPTSQG